MSAASTGTHHAVIPVVIARPVLAVFIAPCHFFDIEHHPAQLHTLNGKALSGAREQPNAHTHVRAVAAAGKWDPSPRALVSVSANI